MALEVKIQAVPDRFDVRPNKMVSVPRRDLEARWAAEASSGGLPSLGAGNADPHRCRSDMEWKVRSGIPS